MFIVSQPALVIAQCASGIVGAFPALNARSNEELDNWLRQIASALNEHRKQHPSTSHAPFAVNHIVHASNRRLEEDLAICACHRVPLVITSLGARREVYEAIHSWGGLVLHDVINDTHARKAIEKGADGLIAVAAGGGGHAGTRSPFALVQEIRRWFDGPLALGGSIATGESVLAARTLGADLAYVGSAFIATHEANASAAYKQMIVDGTSDDIVYTDRFSGTHANYLKGSLCACGIDPDRIDVSPGRMDFSDVAPVAGEKKAWRDFWGCGQGIGAITAVMPAAELVAQFAREFETARRRVSTINLGCP